MWEQVMVQPPRHLMTYMGLLKKQYCIAYLKRGTIVTLRTGILLLLYPTLGKGKIHILT